MDAVAGTAGGEHALTYYEGIAIGLGVVLGLWLLMMGLGAWVSGIYDMEEDEHADH